MVGYDFVICPNIYVFNFCNTLSTGSLCNENINTTEPNKADFMEIEKVRIIKERIAGFSHLWEPIE